MVRPRVPIVDTIKGYRRDWATADLLAGLTLWAVLVPQSLGYATLAGAPPVVGLYTALGAMALYLFFGTSRELNMGPEATVALVAGTSIAPLAAGDAERYLALLAALAVGTAAVSLLGWLLRLGWLTVFLSRPILLGYILGSAVLIASSQLGDLLGTGGSGLLDVVRNLGDAHSWTLAVGALTLLIVLGLRRLGPRVPAYFIGMAAATVAVTLGDLTTRGVAVVGSVPAGLPSIGLPDIAVDDLVPLIGPSFAVALLMYADSMLTERSLAKSNDYDIDADQEFLALGLSNLGSGLLGGFPANGSQSRSVVNDSGGAKTQVSNAVGVVLVVVTLLFLTPLFERVPLAALAAVVLVAAAGLLDVPALRRVWTLSRHDFWLALLTAVLVVWVDVLMGILVAVVLSLVDAALKPYRPNTAVLARVPGTQRFRDVDAVPRPELVPGLLIYRFDAPLYFANAELFADEIRGLVQQADPPVREVLISADAVVDIDSTAHEVLHELIRDLDAAGVRLSIARAKPRLVQVLERSGLAQRVKAFHLEVDAGVATFLEREAAETQPEGRPDHHPTERGGS